MGLFSKNPQEEQIDVYSKHLQEKQERYDKLHGVDTGAAKTEREELSDQIAELKINIEQTRDQLTESRSLNDMSD